MTAKLSLNNLTRLFGGIRAVDGVSFETVSGQITGVIGPNGAGKTTLFNLISGTMRPTTGTVMLDGQDITEHSAARIARLGMVRTFQMTTVFPGCSVFENLYRAAAFRQFPSPLDLFNPVRLPAGRKQAEKNAEQALALIDMEQLADTEAGAMAYGSQKILGVGMALAAQPSILLMDEPAAGLNPVETQAMTSLLRRVHASGIDIVLVEHDMQMVMQLCQRIAVLVNGRLLACGPKEEIQEDPRVVDAYLGADLENA